MPAASDTDFAVFGICCHTVAIDGHVGISAFSIRAAAGDDNLALFNLRQDTRIVKARKNIFAIERNTPLICTRASNF